MKKSVLFCAVALMAIPVHVPAKDFPLEFKTLSIPDVKEGHWSYGAVEMIVATKPAGLLKEPKPVSSHPLYAKFEWHADRTSMLFRLDESKGDGKGYDQLLLDLNQNGDLTDDAAIFPEPYTQPWSKYSGQESTLFGPIEAPAPKRLGAWKPIYYAILDVRTNAILKLRNSPVGRTRDYLGNLRLRAGWYLETTVAMAGITQKVAVIDGDANMRLGDLCKPRFSPDGQWYWPAADGDRILFDQDHSGKFEHQQPFAQILYCDGTPCQFTLASDCQTARIEPWPNPLAEISLEPRGERVRGLTLAWESTKGQWQFINPAVVAGKIKVPPGNYGLWGIGVAAKLLNGEMINAAGVNMDGKKVFSVAVGKPSRLRCGAPLEIKTRTASVRERGGSSSGFWAMLHSWAANLFSSRTDELLIQAEIVGAGGETYSSFSLEGKDGRRPLAKPTFTITADGKQVASGNLEFG